jgi:endonuclease/exonuclease/phosphatase family metal-dependent hydrolase
MMALLDDEYNFHDIADKYGENNRIGRMPFFHGKSNAFLSKAALPYERLYFKYGAKRLIYRIELPGNVYLFFAHFSLQASIRAQQFDEVRKLIEASPGEVIILADFNIMQGFEELKGLLSEDLVILNGREDYTFTLHRSRWVLDLCICSKALAPHVNLKIVQQPFSDHAALLVEGSWV